MAFFCFLTIRNSFMTANIKRGKKPESLRQTNRKTEDSAVGLVSRTSHDWRLMKRVEEDTHE